MRLQPLLLISCLVALGCGDPPVPTANVEGAGPADGGGLAQFKPGEVKNTVLDMVAEANRANVRRGGLVFSPDAPGWALATELAGEGPWQDVQTVNERQAAWLDGIGGTFYFSVGAEGAQLRDLSLWMRPVAPGQVVSIFVDEQPVTTTRVRRGGHFYRFPLPTAGLAPGEHTLRFWFRFTRTQKKKRTPAAVSAIRFLPPGAPVDLPSEWVGGVAQGAVDGPARYAGPPVAWSEYLFVPPWARFRATAVVSEGEPVTFTAHAQMDGRAPFILKRVKVEKGAPAEFDVDLSGFSGRPIRLTLETSGAPRPVEQAAWVEPRLLVPDIQGEPLPPVDNVVVWVVDGLRADRVGLGRGGRAATPNLDLLAREGAAAVDVWSGGATARDGHARLMRPSSSDLSLPTLMAAHGRKTLIVSGSGGIDAGLADDFHSRILLSGETEEDDTRVVLREVDDWLDAHKKSPFFIYAASDGPSGAAVPAGYRAMYERARPQPRAESLDPQLRRRYESRVGYDARVTAADYWIGQLVSVLQHHELAERTAIIVVGSVGYELYESGSTGLGHALVPAVLQVPLVVWHPGMRRFGAPRRIVRGGDLIDVSLTALAVAGAEAPRRAPGHDLIDSLFHGRPLIDRPSHARLGNQMAARNGPWLLNGLRATDLKLWNLRRDPRATEEIANSHPVALRTLRDSTGGER